jgi:hypothetical protein
LTSHTKARTRQCDDHAQMKIHAIETGKVAVHERQREGSGPGPLRLVNTLLDRRRTDRLPIYSWVIEHPEGLIVVDTGETARVAERILPTLAPLLSLRRTRMG